MASHQSETRISSQGTSRPRALYRFAVFTAALTLVLLGAGGLVTSHGVGMAVPDWPNTFGYNMFFFPFSQWVGGVFYEHSHRLVASAAGFCTTVLAVWLYGKKARSFLRWLGVALLVLSLATLLGMPLRWRDAAVLSLTGFAALISSFVWPRGESARPWLRRLGLIAFFAVVLQGILGGMRVVLFKDQIGIFHATLAQLFFALICALALFTSQWWEKEFGSPWGGKREVADYLISQPSTQLAWLCLGATALILVQLVLGATMRHQHAGLAIPDFPLAYGKLWPAMDPGSIDRYNQQRLEVLDANPITAFQVGLQMVHRLVALGIFGMVTYSAWFAWRQIGKRDVSTGIAFVWLGVIVCQALLGMATIWSNKAADIATAHVLVGAISLALGVLLSVILFAQIVMNRRASFVSTLRRTEPSAPFGTSAAPAAGID